MSYKGFHPMPNRAVTEGTFRFVDLRKVERPRNNFFPSVGLDGTANDCVLVSQSPNNPCGLFGQVHPLSPTDPNKSCFGIGVRNLTANDPASNDQDPNFWDFFPDELGGHSVRHAGMIVHKKQLRSYYVVTT